MADEDSILRTAGQVSWPAAASSNEGPLSIVQSCVSAGLVSADDGEAIEMCQQGFAPAGDESALVMMGGRETESVEHMVTEVAIRGMYRYWRETMGL